MAETKWTPGPWEVKRARNGYPYRITAPNGDNRKAGAVGKDVTRWGCFTLPSSAETEANAHLIAAAPDLYEALEACLHSHRDIRLPPEAIYAARAAMAKARGESDG